MEFKSNLDGIEDRFSMLLKSIPIPALLWKKIKNSLTLVNCNEESSRISGGKIKEYIGRKASEIYKNNSQMLEGMQEFALDNNKFNLTANYGNPIVNNGISYKISFELIAPDTVVQFFTAISSVNKKIIKNEIAIIEKELITREKRFQEFVNALPLVVFEIDSLGNLSFVNEKGFELFGYSPEDIENGFNALQLLIPPDRKRALINMARNSKGDNLGGVEYLAQKKNGDIFPVLVYSIPLIDDEKPIGFRGILIDITENKIRDIKLKESEEKYRLLSENSDDLISLYDEKFRLIYVNAESHSRVLGYPAKKFLKASFKNIIAHKDDVIKLINIVKRGIKEGSYRGQIRFKHQDGYYLWFQITAKFFSVELEKRKLLVIAREITDIKQFEENLRKAEEELIKLNNLKSELLVRTSHELKTPLVSIKGFADLLLTVHKSRLDDYSISKITAIKNGADRLQKLIGDILKAAELESGKIKIKLKLGNLSHVINVCMREVRGFADFRNHELEVNIQPNLITIFEQEQIHKVISNLLHNAIKYTPPNGKIEIISEIRANLILTSIKDNGIGITHEEKQIIFKQFGKIERYGQNLEVVPDGTGLGLFISKKMLELHGGEIWAESEGRNQGSTFYFTLPLTQSQ